MLGVCSVCRQRLWESSARAQGALGTSGQRRTISPLKDTSRPLSHAQISHFLDKVSTPSPFPCNPGQEQMCPWAPSTAPSWPAQVVLGTSSLPFRHRDGPKSSQTSHMLTVAGLIARIKTIFFFSFQEGQVLIGLELETALFAFHASHLVFMWGVVYHSYASGGRGLG